MADAFNDYYITLALTYCQIYFLWRFKTCLANSAVRREPLASGRLGSCKAEPRFKRATAVAPIQLTYRIIIPVIHQRRFLDSRQIMALVSNGSLHVLRRLKLLYHHGFLERPSAQLRYYADSGTWPMVYPPTCWGAVSLGGHTYDPGRRRNATP